MRTHPGLLSTAALLLMTTLAPPAAAQSADSLIAEGRRLLAAGVSEADAGRLLAARSRFERAAADAQRARLAEYYAALADFRLIAQYGMVQEDRDRGVSHANAAIERLERLARRHPDFAEAHALLSSAYGQKIGLRPLAGMTLGPRASRAMRRARELAPDNPRVVLLGAIGDYNTPRMWGGSRERAREGFERAIRLFAAERPPADPLSPDWGEDEAFTWLGIAHRAEGRTAEARAAFESALRINPRSQWVRQVLLPSLDARGSR